MRAQDRPNERRGEKRREREFQERREHQERRDQQLGEEREEAGERDAIIAELQERANGYWGFKDPRTLFTLPFWLEAIDKPVFIGTFRHPHRVALSLNSRDDTPIEQGWELWHAYNTRMLELAGEYNFALTDFDAEPDAYLSDTLQKLVALGLDANQANSGSEFFDAGLRNQSGSSVDDVELPAHVTDLYQRLRDYYTNYRT